jgi:tRNA-dihydrouridine synthase B
VGVRSVRKHLGWYVKDLPGGLAFRSAFNQLNDAEQQLRATTDFWDQLAQLGDRLPDPVLNAAETIQ